MKQISKNITLLLACFYLVLLMGSSIVFGCKKDVENQHLIGSSELYLFKLHDTTIWNNTTVEIDSLSHIQKVNNYDQRWTLNDGYILSRNVKFNTCFTSLPLYHEVDDIIPFVIKEDPFTSFFILPQLYGGQYSVELINWWIDRNEIEQNAIKVK